MAGEAAGTTGVDTGGAASTEATPLAAEGASPPVSTVVDPAAPNEVPTERETAIMRNLRRREVEIVERDRRVSADRNSTKAERDALAKERAAFQTERETAAARDRAFREDPIGYATRELGIRDEDLARRWVRGGKPAPEELEYRRGEDIKAELKKRDDEIARINGTLEQRTKAEQAASQAAANAKAVGDFIALAKASVTTHPFAARLLASDEAEFIEEADSLAGKMARTDPQWATRGTAGNFAEVLSRLERKYAKAAGVPATAGTENETATDPRDPRVEPKTAPTLTGKTASQRSTTATDDDPLLDVLDRDKGRKKTFKAIDDALAARKSA